MRIRTSVLPLLLLGVVACPKDKKKGAGDSVAVAPPIVADTTPTDLSSMPTSLPPAAPDTFKPLPPKKQPRQQAAAPSYPQAPSALMDAVQRSQTVSKFCYQEFGQKVDPSLRGGVAMLVTVGESGITDARVANDNWSSRTGKAVNECLNEKAKLAWKLTPGDVKSGKYYVQLAFTGS
ncbi:MAG TPA: hypothetical protein VFN38_03580 [Gemmatimonadaceae bacterium]|nr:hypothetical protein [Gemmatimonadaceae bacterium]